MARYEVDAKIRRVRYALRHDYDEPTRIGSTCLHGDFRHLEGHYDLTDRARKCLVALRQAIDPGLRSPRPVVRVVDEAVMGRALAELRERAQAVQEA